jgi:hypothetical protein
LWTGKELAVTGGEKLLSIINGADPNDSDDVELRRALFRVLRDNYTDKLEQIRLTATARGLATFDPGHYQNEGEERCTIAEGKSRVDDAFRLCLTRDSDPLEELVEEWDRQQPVSNSQS